LIGNTTSNLLVGGSGADVLVGDAGNDTLQGGANADTLSGGSSNDWIQGGNGNNVLFGDSGNDFIFGGINNDILYGGSGKDFMSSGTGKDIFVFNTKPSSKTNVDTIQDFNVKYDTIYLENGIFKALGRNGTMAKPGKIPKKMFSVGDSTNDKDDHLIYDKKTGTLFYDDDGNGKHAAVVIAILPKNLNPTYNDFLLI
jgi:Ca2+-binding RTX toxin-like protein